MDPAGPATGFRLAAALRGAGRSAHYGDAFELAPLIALGIAQILEPKISRHRHRAEPDFLDRVETRARVYPDRLRRRRHEPLLAGASAPRGFRRERLRIGWHAVVHAGGQRRLSAPLSCSGSFAVVAVDGGTGDPHGVSVHGGHAGEHAGRRPADPVEPSRLAADQLAEANRQLQQAEEAVRRSDRLAALGQLSAGLAHELRNPLGTIKASSEMLGRSVAAENEVAREMAGFITSEVDRTNSLITRFLQFARPLELRLDTADLAQLLDRGDRLARTRSAGDPDIQELRARDPALSLRRRTDGAGVLQPGAERRAGHPARRRRDREDAGSGGVAEDRGDRPRVGHRRRSTSRRSSIRFSPPSPKASGSGWRSFPRSWTNTAVR